MQRRLIVTLTLVMIIATMAVSNTIPNTYGHGLGTDTSLPATISNKQVVVEASLTPTFIDEVESGSPRFVVRVLEAGSGNTTISNMDLRVVVSLRNEALLDQRFRSSDGVVAANLVPDPEITGWQINGQAPPEQVQISQSNPIQLRSKIMTEGGLYHIAVTIERSSSGIAVDSDKRFDLYVSIGSSHAFDVAGGNQMIVKTYFDEVSNFNYSNGTISFDMPFTWDRAYVSQVPVLHMEVQFPKSMEELKTNSYRGTLNGRELEAQAVVIDDYSSEQYRIVHFVVNNAMLTRFAETVGDTDTARFTLMPTEKPKFPLDIMSLPTERFLVQLSWGPDVIETGTPITFVMNIKDPTTDDIIRGSSFDFVVTQDGREIHRRHMSEELGLYSFQYTFPTAGTVTLAIDRINDQGESAKIDLVVLQGSGEAVPPPVQQPSGCLIATAAFGSELTPQVQYLRNFRDNYILSTASGAAFMNAFNSVYYSFSPQVADYEREQPWLQATIRTALYPLFGILTAAERSYSIAEGEPGAILAGATASTLIGAIYLVPAGYVASRKVKISWLVFAVAAATAVMLVTLPLALPTLLSISTSVFIVVTAGASAIAAGKAIRYAVHRSGSN
jgi:peptide/nickel transport system substrate-binding protein